MPILVDENNTHFQSADPQQIYNALKSGSYKLLPNSDLYVKDANNDTWQLDPTNGDINAQLIGTFEAGGRFETKDEAFQRIYPELKGASGAVVAGVASAANSALFGVPAVLASGSKAGELFSSLRNTHPIASMVGDVAGLVSDLTPAGAVINTAGKVAGAAVSGAGKVASLAAEGATIGGLSGVPLGLTENALGEPGHAAEHFIGSVGGGILLGAVASPLIGIAAPKIADLFGAGTSKATQAANEGLGKVTTKVANEMTPEQQQLFNNLVKDPELRATTLKLTKDVEEVTIKSTAEDLQNLSKLIDSDMGQLYNTKFQKIVEDLPKEKVLMAKQEMLDLIKQAKESIRLNPESYNSKYLDALTAAEKTLDVRGAGNISTRQAMEDALKRLSSDKYPEIQKAMDLASAKAIKEARTEITYKPGFDGAKMGIDRTSILANDLRKSMSDVSARLYGDEFVKISDTYHAAQDVLKNVKKLAFNSDNTVNYNKVKSMIGENKASELKLDDLLERVQSLSQISGKEYNFGSTLNDTLSNLRSKQLLRSMSKDNLITAGTLTGLAGGEFIANQVGIPPGVSAMTFGLYKTLKNPRSALGLMNFLQQSQVQTANAVNKIAKFASDNKNAIIKADVVGKQSYKSTKAEIQKDIQTYQIYSSPQSIDEGYKKTFGILDKIAPNMSATVKAKSIDVANFLSSKMPHTNKNPLTGELEVIDSTQKIKEYQQYKQAVNNPLDALKQLDSGINVSLNREVLQNLFPSIWGSYVQNKLQSIYGKDLTIEQKRHLNNTLGLQSDDFTLPSVTNNVLNIQGDNNGMPPQRPKSIPSPSKAYGTSNIQRPSGK
jgi:hypothetical protein